MRKHADTKRVNISLRRHGRTVRLEVQDHGRGFPSTALAERATPGQQVGLAGMQERVGLLGGHWSIHSRPGAGTRVVAELPLPALAKNGPLPNR